MPEPEVKKYDYGARVRHTIQIVRDSDGRPIDPTSLQLYFVNPSGGREGPFTPTRTRVGGYYYERTYTAVTPSTLFGDWSAVWMGTGTGEGSRIKYFHINSVAGF